MCPESCGRRFVNLSKGSGNHMLSFATFFGLSFPSCFTLYSPPLFLEMEGVLLVLCFVHFLAKGCVHFGENLLSLLYWDTLVSDWAQHAGLGDKLYGIFLEYFFKCSPSVGCTLILVSPRRNRV